MSTISDIREFNPTSIYIQRKHQNQLYSIGRKYKDEDIFSVDEQTAEALTFYNFITPHKIRDKNRELVNSGKYKMTPIGRIYYEYLDDVRREHKAETMRWRITTIIAALALAFSLFSLGWQVYTYKMEHNQVKNPPIQSETTDMPIDSKDNAINTIQP